MRLILAVDLDEECVEFSPLPRSELEYGCREDIEPASACMRDAFVHIEESLDFFESIRGSLKILELLDVPDRTLEASLGFLGTACRPVALWNRLATPDEADIRESGEQGRDALIWKFDRGRAITVLSADKITGPKIELTSAIFRNRRRGHNWYYGHLAGSCRMAPKPFKQVLSKKAIFIITASKMIQFKPTVKTNKTHFSNPSEFATASSSSRWAKVTLIVFFFWLNIK